MGEHVYSMDVSAREFKNLRWVEDELPTSAVVVAGSDRTHVANAIKALSSEIPTDRVYRRTGWVKTGDDWSYIHAGGAIGAAANGSIESDLDCHISAFDLPEPTEETDVVHCVRGVLRILELGRDELVYPLLAAPFRAVLGEADFGIWIEGETGVFKSELASLLQRFFGPTMSADNLPGRWTSTDNALELLTFLAKDTLFVIDDWRVGPGTRSSMEALADRLFRRLGRQRMNSKQKLSTWTYPRALMVSTGEQCPERISLLARMLVVRVEQGDIDRDVLTGCQEDAKCGVYAAVMRGFVEFLAPSLDEVRSDLSDYVEGKRADARLPST